MQVSTSLLEYLSDILLMALEKITRSVDTESRKESKNPALFEEMWISLKMLIFLMLYFLHVSCVKKPKTSFTDELKDFSSRERQTTKKGSKRRGALKEISKDAIPMLLKQHAKCLSGLRIVLSIDLRFLWQKPVEDEFYRYFTDVCVRMIESRQLLKDQKQAKEDIFGILETVLLDNSSAVKNFELKLINLVYEEEQLVEPISEFITRAYKSPLATLSKLSTETLAMLVNYILEKTNVNAESQAVKNTKEILCRVAQQIPKAFYVNLSAFMCLYESEAYLLRNALTEILTEIIKSVLTQKEETGDDLDNQDAYKKAKIRLLDKLVKRVNDKNAYSRAHVMKSLVDLCTSNVVPQQYLKVMLQKGCERIKDISANVRKKALELLDKVIRIYYNIFVGNVDSGFMSSSEIQRQQQFNSEEEEDARRQISAIEEKARSQLRGIEEYEKLQSDLRIQRRKLESLKTQEEHITEYLHMLNSIEKVKFYAIFDI